MLHIYYDQTFQPFKKGLKKISFILPVDPIAEQMALFLFLMEDNDVKGSFFKDPGWCQAVMTSVSSLTEDESCGELWEFR